MVDVTDVTEGTIAGNGYFDKFMAAIDAHLAVQYSKKRIQGPDYATVYLGALQTALSQAVAYVGVVEQVAASAAKTTSETALLDQRTKTEMAQILDTVDSVPVVGAIGKQKDLQTAQTNGFSRDAEQKAAKILLDSWSISRSVIGAKFPVPSGAINTDIEDVLIKLRQGINITESIYAGVADAGSDQTVAISSFVLLDASGSTSRPDGNAEAQPPSAYTWSQISGADVMDTFSNINSQKPSFTAHGSATVLVFQVFADYANSVPITGSADTVTITVE